MTDMYCIVVEDSRGRWWSPHSNFGRTLVTVNRKYLVSNLVAAAAQQGLKPVLRVRIKPKPLAQ